MIFFRNKNDRRTRQNLSNDRVSINENLASIGGLFGAISIIITGFLLYAIFTAKSEDKWYYITAVLINVALLLMLMIGAIIFDKIYLKKWINIARPSEQRQNTSTISNDPEIFDRTTTNAESQNSPSVMIDVPPDYPGYYQSSTFNSQQQNLPNHSNIVLITANNDFTTNLNTKSTTKTKDDEIKLNLPPHYTDLYPNTTMTVNVVKNDQ